MKKLFALLGLLCAFTVVCCSFTACGDEASTPQDDILIIDPDDDGEKDENPVLPQKVPNEELKGNVEKYSVANTLPLAKSDLEGKTIYWLGSSVT